MSLFSWFILHNKKRRAQLIIQSCMTKQKELGLFHSDPSKSAHQVVAFVTNGRSQDAIKPLDIHVLAAMWAVMFVTQYKASREEISDYGTLAALLLAIAGQMADRGELGPADMTVIGLLLKELNRFYDESPINLDLQPNTDVSPPAVQEFHQEAIVISVPHPIFAAKAEYEYLNKVYGNDGAWTAGQQMLFENNGRTYDKLVITLRDGTTKTVLFDLTSSYKT